MHSVADSAFVGVVDSAAESVEHEPVDLVAVSQAAVVHRRYSFWVCFRSLLPNYIHFSCTKVDFFCLLCSFSLAKKSHGKVTYAHTAQSIRNVNDSTNTTTRTKE